MYIYTHIYIHLHIFKKITEITEIASWTYKNPGILELPEPDCVPTTGN